MQYNKWGGREQELKAKAEKGFKGAVGVVEAEAKNAVDGIKSAVGK